MNKLPNWKSSTPRARLNMQIKKKCDAKINAFKQLKCDTKSNAPNQTKCKTIGNASKETKRDIKTNKVAPKKPECNAKCNFLSMETNTDQNIHKFSDEQYISCLNYINSIHDLILKFLESTITLTLPDIPGVSCIQEKIKNFFENYSSFKNNTEKPQSKLSPSNLLEKKPCFNIPLHDQSNTFSKSCDQDKKVDSIPLPTVGTKTNVCSNLSLNVHAFSYTNEDCVKINKEYDKRVSNDSEEEKENKSLRAQTTSNHSLHLFKCNDHTILSQNLKPADKEDLGKSLNASKLSCELHSKSLCLKNRIKFHTQIEMQLVKLVGKLTKEISRYGDYSRKGFFQQENPKFSPRKKIGDAESSKTPAAHESRSKRSLQRYSKSKHNIDISYTKSNIRKSRSGKGSQHKYDSVTENYKYGHERSSKYDDECCKTKLNHRSKEKISFCGKSNYSKDYYNESLWNKSEPKKKWWEKQINRGKNVKVDLNLDAEVTASSSTDEEMIYSPTKLREKIEKQILFETERYTRYYEGAGNTQDKEDQKPTTNNLNNSTKQREIVSNNQNNPTKLDLSKFRRTIERPPVPEEKPKGPQPKKTWRIKPPSVLRNSSKKNYSTGIQQDRGDVKKELILNADSPQDNEAIVDMLLGNVTLNADKSKALNEKPINDLLVSKNQEQGNQCNLLEGNEEKSFVSIPPVRSNIFYFECSRSDIDVHTAPF